MDDVNSKSVALIDQPGGSAKTRPVINNAQKLNECFSLLIFKSLTILLTVF